MRGSLRLVLSLTVGWALLAACSSGGAPQEGSPVPSPKPSAMPATISGTVTKLDRRGLPDDAIVIVTLWNATTGDSMPVARMEFQANGQQVPIPYELSYDASEIDPAQEYVLAGEIDSAGRAIYRTNSSIPVITQGHPADDVEIVLEPVQ